MNWTLDQLLEKARREGVSMSELGRRGGLTTARRRHRRGNTNNIQRDHRMGTKMKLRAICRDDGERFINTRDLILALYKTTNDNNTMTLSYKTGLSQHLIPTLEKTLEGEGYK